jgi:isatin hydrolase
LIVAQDSSAVFDTLSEYEVIDLTLTLDERYPAVARTLPGFHHRVWNYFKPVDDGPQPLMARSWSAETDDEPTEDRPNVFYSNFMVLFEHTGTHFDAPTHVIPPADSGFPGATEHGLFGDQITLDRLQGRGCVIDVRELQDNPPIGDSPLVTIEHVKAWEAEHGALTSGDAVIFWTGWDRYYLPYPQRTPYQEAFSDKSLPGWTAIPEDTMMYLFDAGVRLVGTDGVSIGAVRNVYGVHYAGLGKGMLYVESLTSLGSLPPRGSYFVFCPLKISRSSGCSGRAFAYVPRAS